MAKFETELPKPDNMDVDVFRRFVLDVYADDVYPGMYRLDKGQPNDRYVFWWDDTNRPMPSPAERLADFQAWRVQNTDKEIEMDRAKEYLLAYDDRKRVQILGQRAKALLPASPTNAQVKNAIETVVDQWWADNP